MYSTNMYSIHSKSPVLTMFYSSRTKYYLLTRDNVDLTVFPLG